MSSKKSKPQFVMADVSEYPVWKLPVGNGVWELPDGVLDVRFDLETRPGGWRPLKHVAGLAVDRGGKVWGWRTLQNPQESGYVLEGKVSVGGQKVRAFTSSQMFMRADGSLCDVAILYLCRPKEGGA